MPETASGLVIDITDQPAHIAESEDGRTAGGRWLAAALLSITINALLILVIFLTLPPLPTQLPKPIPVSIVPPSALPKPKQTPPTNPPANQPHQSQKQKQRQAPSGRRASREQGDPNAPESAKMGSDAPAAGPVASDEGSEQPTDQGSTTKAEAARQEERNALGAEKPKQVKEPKPIVRRGGTRVRTVNGLPHASRHHAQYPGPDATQDQYAVYMTQAFEACYTPKILSDMQGVGHSPILAFTLRHNGIILWPYIKKSSGSAALDQDFLGLVDCVGRLAPLPEYVEEPSVTSEFGDLEGEP